MRILASSVTASAITFRLVVSYRGEHFHGVPTQPGVRTVASALTEALSTVTTEKPVALAFAARTDAGVGARMNLCSFRLEQAPDFSRIRLPPDLRILDVTQVPRSYHARNSSLGKHYRYRITREPSDHAWPIAVPLDLDVMRTLAAHFMGTHDFTALRHPRCSANNPVKTIESIRIRERGPLVVIDVLGDGFLRQQVRILVGTLASTGAGWLTIDHVRDAFSRRDRSSLGPSAPARGLVLMRVRDALPRRDRAP